MSAEQTTSLMQRKARTGSEAYAARAMSLGRALRLTAAKQADQMMALALGVLSVTRSSVTAGDLTPSLEVPWLTMMMDGPGSQVAAVMIDPVLVAGLIQQQTMCKITPALEGGEQRAHTSTDAALCAPFIEALLSNAALLPEEEVDRDLLSGYRFGVLAQEPRHAQLALDAVEYNVIEMTLDLAAGTRTGQLRMILPEPVDQPEESTSEPDAPPIPSGGKSLSANVMGLNAELTIALTRLKLPLQKVSALQVGDVVPLNLSSMTHAMILGANGVVLSRGTLGQIDGARALQVEPQKARQQSEPRRRISDRAELDLPDVTAPHIPAQTAEMLAEEAAANLSIPSISDVDIFGDLDDLPDMPELEEASRAADAQMEEWKSAEADEGIDAREKTAGW
jgi:flagellar motor switch/type III secretory pathway protein FliN